MFLFLVFLCVLSKESNFYVEEPKFRSPNDFNLEKLTVTHRDIFHYFSYEENNQVQMLSPWHSIPLFAKQSSEKGDPARFHFVCEIPSDSTVKNEINKEDKFNPIMPDYDDGKIRHVNIGVNYGAFPQTYEDKEAYKHIGIPGDMDPVDGLLWRDEPCTVGEVVEVQIVGCIGLVDSGELDWKIFLVPAGSGKTVIADLPDHEPERIRDYFKTYKINKGNGENTYIEGEIFKPVNECVRAVIEGHAHWNNLIRRLSDKVEL